MTNAELDEGLAEPDLEALAFWLRRVGKKVLEVERQTQALSADVDQIDRALRLRGLEPLRSLAPGENTDFR